MQYDQVGAEVDGSSFFSEVPGSADYPSLFLRGGGCRFVPKLIWMVERAVTIYLFLKVSQIFPRPSSSKKFQLPSNLWQDLR